MSDWQSLVLQLEFINVSVIYDAWAYFELRVLTVIDCPKIAGAKGW